MSARPAIGFLILSAIACGSGRGGPVSELAEVSAERSGSHCTNGGISISIGLDLNADRALDASEVTAVYYVCASSAGEARLVSIEPPGANCIDGGQQIETGPDANGDGVLEPSEVTATEYLCAGPPGAPTRLAISAEPPGANCQDGGLAIAAGNDSDGDGLLEPAEIRSTTFLCQPIASANRH